MARRYLIHDNAGLFLGQKERASRGKPMNRYDGLRVSHSPHTPTAEIKTVATNQVVISPPCAL